MRFDPRMKPPLLSSLTICLILGLLHSTPTHSAAAGKVTPPPIPLWPQLAPDDAAPTEVEKDMSAPTDALVAGKRVIRLGNVSQPTVTFYPAPRRKSNGAAVLVCPGGGYHILAMDLEGTEVCEWLNSIGVSAALLKYRVPVRKDRERYAAPLQDAQRALSLVRQHATEWNIDSKRIGILGFSAGGHGYGLRPTAEAVTRWPELAGDWMRRLGVLSKAK